MRNENPFKPDQTPTYAESTKEAPVESRDLQAMDVVPATEIPGFGDLTVVITLEKKEANRKKKGEEEHKDIPVKRNQDNVLADPKTGLLGVFDGLGASKNPDGASRAAARAITSSWDRALASWEGDFGEIEDTLVEAYSDADVKEAVRSDTVLARKAHALVMSLDWANQPVIATGGMTTACVGFVHSTADGTRWLVAANIGDSGAFIRHADGRLEQATMEDSSLSRVLSTRALSLEQMYRMKTAPTTKFSVPFFGGEADYLDLANSVPEPLGWAQGIMPLLSIRRLQPGDEVLFCTDGIIDKYEKIVTEIPPPDQMTAEQLNMKTFAEDTSDGKTFTERVDNLRIHAGFRRAYKSTDDSAIVGVKIPEALK